MHQNHRLSDRAYARLTSEIDQLLLKDGYQPGPITDPDVGYIFCPEHRTGQPERIYPEGSDTAIWLFGPTLLPDEDGSEAGRSMLPLTLREVAPPADTMVEVPSPAARHEKSSRSNATTRLASGSPSLSGSPEILSDPTNCDDTWVPSSAKPGLARKPGGTRVAGSEQTGTEAHPTEVPSVTPEMLSSTATMTQTDPVEIALGETLTHVPVHWSVSIRTNPHLMIVGLPGMGKTTALINIVEQLTEARITPVIFSYHDDIDDRLIASIGPMRMINFDGLGFNPLRVDAPGPMAYIDVVGTLRDIFGSIFPDLGEIQLEELRGAIKQSYDDLGWNDRTRQRPQ
ncbi:MAG TPA: hypothetical protein VMB73_32925, partial [Acetobacteraceae bacterium]|nr:hypothetical protein [Acetobacteraceae bacterium]